MSQQVNPDDKTTFYKALLALHGDIEAMKRTEGNPFFKSKYVPLPDMLDALKPVLQKHGFILSQPVDIAPAQPHTQTVYSNVVISQLTHADTGLSETSKMVLPAMEDMQKLGGAITYARRYTLSALVSGREIDDDGNTAVGKSKKGKNAVEDKDNF